MLFIVLTQNKYYWNNNMFSKELQGIDPLNSSQMKINNNKKKNLMCKAPY